MRRTMGRLVDHAMSAINHALGPCLARGDELPADLVKFHFGLASHLPALVSRAEHAENTILASGSYESCIPLTRTYICPTWGSWAGLDQMGIACTSAKLEAGGADQIQHLTGAMYVHTYQALYKYCLVASNR